MKNPFGCVENIIEDQNTKNDKNKTLENLIDNKYAFINVIATPKTGFVDEVTKIFI